MSAALAGAGGEASVVEAAAGCSEDSEVIGKMREELGAPDTLGVIETGVRNDPLLVFKLPGSNIAHWASPLLLLGRSHLYRFIQIFLKSAKIYDQILKIFPLNWPDQSLVKE